MRRAIEEGLVDVAHSIEVGLRGLALRQRADWTGLRSELGLDYLTTEDVFRARAGRGRRARSASGSATGRRSSASTSTWSTRPTRPGTGTPEAGGPSAHDMLAIVRGLTGIDFVGFDVVEVIPAYDPAGQTATLAANLAYEMLSLVALRRPRPMTGAREAWRVAPCRRGFRWPDGVRAAACFTFDVDAESPILFDHPESAGLARRDDPPGVRPADRRRRGCCALLDRQAIRATFFVPGYSRRALARRSCRSIRDAGHEIAHHGYLHEGAHGAEPGRPRSARLLRGLAALDAVAGVRPDRLPRPRTGS